MLKIIKKFIKWMEESSKEEEYIVEVGNEIVPKSSFMAWWITKRYIMDDNYEKILIFSHDNEYCRNIFIKDKTFLLFSNTRYYNKPKNVHSIIIDKKLYRSIQDYNWKIKFVENKTFIVFKSKKEYIKAKMLAEVWYL